MADKTISLADLALLKKVLGMLGSDADGEVVAAGRRATKIMRDNKLSWDDLFGRLVNASGSAHSLGVASAFGEDEVFEETEEVPMSTKIKRAFDTLRGVELGGFRSFVDSIEKTWLETNFLTPGQRAPLFDAVKRHNQRRKG